MRTSTIVMTAFAVVFGLLAVFVAQSWLNRQAELRMKSIEANKKPVVTRSVVVAAKPLRFGHALTPGDLREIEWPAGALPSGAFAKANEILGEGRRVVLAPIETNEPVLSAKITGAGQRATLSARLSDGLRAVTVRVNDVDGVAGFILPGDRVDVQLTRQLDKNAATNQVVLQNAKVMAIDQLADERTDKPTVARSVTLEVDTLGAQKVSLAAAVGSLSLVLRRAGEGEASATRRITLSDLGTPAAAGPKKVEGNVRTVSVTRAAVRQEYSVPVEGGGLRADYGGY